MIESVTSFLVSGQLWFTLFVALVSAMYFTMLTTGMDNHLKWQLNLTNTKNRVYFGTVFAVIFLVYLGIGLAASTF